MARLLTLCSLHTQTAKTGSNTSDRTDPISSSSLPEAITSSLWQPATSTPGLGFYRGSQNHAMGTDLRTFASGLHAAIGHVLKQRGGRGDPTRLRRKSTGCLGEAFFTEIVAHPIPLYMRFLRDATLLAGPRFVHVTFNLYSQGKTRALTGCLIFGGHSKAFGRGWPFPGRLKGSMP